VIQCIPWHDRSAEKTRIVLHCGPTVGVPGRRLPAEQSTAAGVAAAAATEWERPADSAATDLCQASTSYGSDGTTRHSRPSHGRRAATDTGIMLAAAEEEANDADREDMQNAMLKFLPEGDKKRILGAVLFIGYAPLHVKFAAVDGAYHSAFITSRVSTASA